MNNQIIELLKYPPYLSFSLSVFFSQVAYNMLNIVLIFLIFHLTSSNFAVSILLFVILLPQICLSFFGGVIADTHNRRVILVVGNVLRAASLFLLFFNFNNVAIVYVVTLLVSVITQFYVPAESPIIPALVKKEKLVAANSIFGISLFGSILVGYVVAGPLIAVVGRSFIFLILSALFLIAGFFAFFIPDNIGRKEKSEVEPEISLKDKFFDSYAILGRTRELGDSFFLLVFSQVIIFILATLIPGYAESILEVPAEDLSLILFGPAALGMVVSALLIGSLFNKAKKDNLMNLGIVISGIVLALLPFTSRIFSQGIIQTINLFMPTYLAFNTLNFVLLLAFFAGFANALIFVPAQAAVQEFIPEDFRSKVYGLLFALIGIFSLFPILIAGGIADIVGVGVVLFILGACIILAALFRQRESILKFRR